jgi:transcriptional antiterminator
MSDLKKIPTLIKKYELDLQYSRNKGYRIVGEEVKIRVLISDLVEQVLYFPDGLNEFSNLAHVQIEPLIHFVRRVERMLGITYSDDAFNFLIRDLQMTISRNLSHSYSKETYFKNKVTGTEEYDAVCEYAYSEWIKQSDDLEWIALAFLASNIFRGNPKVKDQQLRAAIDQMIQLFQDKTYVEIRDRSVFEKRLLAHIRPAYFRVKYGLTLNNLGIENIIRHDRQHKALIEAIKLAIKPVELFTGKNFPTNELELIS